MTRDDVIKMAREAGIGGMLTDVVCTTEELERFAGLVAAAEREACAKVSEGFPENRTWVPGSLWGNIRSEVAAAIRARKDAK